MSLARLGGIQPGRIGLFAGSLAHQPADVQRTVLSELERLGYGTMWCGEAAGRDVLVQAAIALAATSTLVVATGIASIYARDPQAAANGARGLAEAWPGRFMLGLGVSHRPLVTGRGHEYGPPVAAMRSYLDGIERAAWRGPAAELPPIVLAALGPKMAALAAERTAGAYPYFTTAEHIASLRQQIGPEAFIAADLPVVLAGQRAAAREIGDRHTNVYLRLDNYRNNLLRLGWPKAELEPPGSDRLFDAVVAWGDLEAIQSRVQAHLAAGADQVVLNLIVADPLRPYLEELRRLAPVAAIEIG